MVCRRVEVDTTAPGYWSSALSSNQNHKGTISSNSSTEFPIFNTPKHILRARQPLCGAQSVDTMYYLFVSMNPSIKRLRNAHDWVTEQEKDRLRGRCCEVGKGVTRLFKYISDCLPFAFIVYWVISCIQHQLLHSLEIFNVGCWSFPIYTECPLGWLGFVSFCQWSRFGLLWEFFLHGTAPNSRTLNETSCSMYPGAYSHRNLYTPVSMEY